MRKALSDHPALPAFFSAKRRVFEIMNRGDRTNTIGEIHLLGPEAQEFVAAQQEVARLNRELRASRSL
jgi:hypothetical protein